MLVTRRLAQSEHRLRQEYLTADWKDLSGSVSCHCMEMEMAEAARQLGGACGTD